MDRSDYVSRLLELFRQHCIHPRDTQQMVADRYEGLDQRSVSRYWREDRIKQPGKLRAESVEALERALEKEGVPLPAAEQGVDPPDDG